MDLFAQIKKVEVENIYQVFPAGHS